MKKKACFFSNTKKEKLFQEQYSLSDIYMLEELGYDLTIATKFSEIPWNCDIYYSWWASGSILPFIVASIMRKPIIVVAGGNEAMIYRDSVSNLARGYLATKWYKKIATRITLRFSTRIIIVSEFMRRNVITLGARNPFLVYNSVDTNKFISLNLKRSTITTIFKLDNEVIELKRGYILLQAIPLVLNKYPKVIFTFIGEKGNGYDDFFNKCKELGIQNNVQFTNNVLNKEVVNWMQCSKLYIQISDTETFGVAIAEAMSCKTPVVVSKRGAISEVAGEFGIYVNQNNPNDVAMGIIKCLNMSDEEREILGCKLRNRIVSQFSFEKRKEVIKNIIDSI